MNEHYQEYLRNLSPYPGDWGRFSGAAGSLGDQWDRFSRCVIDLTADILWPEFVPCVGWRGRSAATMELLTRTDLELMLHIQQAHPKEIDRQISSPVGSAGRSTHRQLFEMEDDNGAIFGTYHNQYDTTLPYALLETIPVLFKRGLDAKCGLSRLQFKEAMQRPRAFQMATALGYSRFVYLQAKSADTPSLCSGHCLQGVLAVSAVMERFLVDGSNLSADSWAALQQYAVDIGDRRVMAGVHYPADNISSWLIALLMADHVFQTPRVKEKMAEAIFNRSYIYGAIADWVGQGKGDVYGPALDALRDAADGKLTL